MADVRGIFLTLLFRGISCSATTHDSNVMCYAKRKGDEKDGRRKVEVKGWRGRGSVCESDIMANLFTAVNENTGSTRFSLGELSLPAERAILTPVRRTK